MISLLGDGFIDAEGDLLALQAAADGLAAALAAVNEILEKSEHLVAGSFLP